jgi:ubiquinone/menaquinone biosynthesis C-methylase UbiE
MDNKKPVDNWADGDAYEQYIGRWSRLVAPEFLSWLNAPADKDWLDVGCGTGALTQTVLNLAQPNTMTSIDRSEGFVAVAQRQVTDARVTFKIGDAQNLPLETAAYDVAVSGLVLNFVAQPAQAAAEVARVMRPSGVFGAYVWDYPGKMQMTRHFWNAATALDPAAYDLDQGRRFPLCRPEALEQLFKSAGFKNVEVRAIDIPTDFRDFDDYWSPYLGGQGPAPTYVMSLSEERRTALRERLRNSLPVALDGSIPLFARAWAVKGVR